MKTLNEKNKETYRIYIEEIFNKRDFSQLDQHVSDDYVLHDAPDGFPKGKVGIKSVVNMFKGAFSDFEVHLDELICEGDLIASKSTFKGTHTGQFLGFEATQKKIRMTSLTLVRIKEGKIYESWVRNDIENLKRQL